MNSKPTAIILSRLLALAVFVPLNAQAGTIVTPGGTLTADATFRASSNLGSSSVNGDDVS